MMLKSMIYFKYLIVCLGIGYVLCLPSSVNAKDTVVLLHGIGQSKWNMVGIETTLEKSGYDVLNLDYPSMDQSIVDLSAFLNQRLQDEEVWQSQSNRIHFVTHSMGGLVLDTYLQTYKKDIPSRKLGRVVMLAPPHGGSEIADILQDLKLYQWIYGPAGQDLTSETRRKSTSDVYYDLGIIAGNKEWPYLIAAHIIPGDNDGRVAVEQTKLNGMNDHIELSATHIFIAWKPAVHKQIVNFIKNGKFNHGE